ncbi:MAG: ComF family protein [Myxococcota bacterium]|nr:ComF family protein [Myxococcota bacterium]MDW8361113.1 ComF family protein [Myxococcales bacterium]
MRPTMLLCAIADLVAPRRCCACDAVLPAGSSTWCAACETACEPAPPSALPPAPHAAVFQYGGAMAIALRRYKYAGRSELARPLGNLLAAAAPAYGDLVDAVVPVPPHPSRLRERGFDPVALLSAPLARALGVPHRLEALRRVRPTPPQAGLDARARAANVRGAFVAASKRPLPRAVLLVDDVRTTGATLAECTRVLRDAGVGSVYSVTLAMATGDSDDDARDAFAGNAASW